MFQCFVQTDSWKKHSIPNVDAHLFVFALQTMKLYETKEALRRVGLTRHSLRFREVYELPEGAKDYAVSKGMLSRICTQPVHCQKKQKVTPFRKVILELHDPSHVVCHV